MRISAHAQSNTKTIQHFRTANIRRLSLHIKHSANGEAVAKIQDKQAAKLRSTEHVPRLAISSITSVL